ncbi:hydrolase, alpha beta fold family protein (Partial), partial [Seminavis robusta]|eukprot:Sro73_g040160.1 hydrolase, alpha beta fold family protein (280) ;mRNA; r:2-842
MRLSTSAFLLALTLAGTVEGFFPSLNNNAAATNTKLVDDVSFVPPDTTEILEDACRDTAARMKRVKVPVSTAISPKDGQVGISYVHWPAVAKKKNLPPVVLVHGFDSSCLEYRRLGSRLAAQGVDVYAVDILGWGYTQLEDVADFSAAAKVEALQSFVNTVIGEQAPYCVAGASLGGAAAIELAASSSSGGACQGLILIDAQGFVDGVGPMAALPKFLAQAGVAVLKSVPLRSSANQMSYFDKETYATDDALAIGRLHCVQQGDLWSDAMVSFMKSGGFS